MNIEENDKVLKCEISGCGKIATASVQYAHEQEYLQWNAKMCNDCMKDAFSRKGNGEFIFQAIKKEEYKL